MAPIQGSVNYNLEIYSCISFPPSAHLFLTAPVQTTTEIRLTCKAWPACNGDEGSGSITFHHTTLTSINSNITTDIIAIPNRVSCHIITTELSDVVKTVVFVRLETFFVVVAGDEWGQKRKNDDQTGTHANDVLSGRMEMMSDVVKALASFIAVVNPSIQLHVFHVEMWCFLGVWFIVSRNLGVRGA